MEFPFGYSESFLIVFGLFLTGIIIEFVTNGNGFPAIKYPYNLWFGSIFLYLILVLYLIFRRTNFVKWFSSVPASISAIVFFASVVLLLGLIPQYEGNDGTFLSQIGFNHILNSWLYLISQLFFLLSLGLVILKKLFPFRKRNIVFLLNHCGLWIVIFAAGIGSGQLERLKMNLHENEIIWYAFDKEGKVKELPIALKLIDFDILEYPPDITIIDNNTGDIIQTSGLKKFSIETGKNDRIGDWEISIEKFYLLSGKNGDNYYFNNGFGASPAAFVKLKNIKSNESAEGWISCGSFAMQHEALNLNEKYSAVMIPPQPKEFSSLVKILTKNGVSDSVMIKVNEPYRIDGWKLYQHSYDMKMGKWSSSSVIELVKDPWLSVVYLGIFMMIAGAIFLFWTGKRSYGYSFKVGH